MKVRTVILLFATFVTSISCLKKQNWVCSVIPRLEGFYLEECHNWWSQVWNNWKTGDWNAEYVAVIIGTELEVQPIFTKMRKLKNDHNQTFYERYPTIPERTAYLISTSKKEDDTTAFFKNIDEERFFQKF